MAQSMSHDWSRREVLIATIARLLDGVRHVAVGAASPIPAAGALLARELSRGNLTVSLLGSERHNNFTDGGTELFDCAAQGRIDAFFLSGVQIDGGGNVNLLGLGPPEHLMKRFAGCFGSPYLAFLVPRLILFREEHNARTLVERVDFVSAPGTSEPGIFRPGGPKALLTGRCLFLFRNGAFELVSLHPGQTVAEVTKETGFKFRVSPEVAETPTPDAAILEVIRGPVQGALASAYPRFADKLLATQT
jgi:glutaconate CoA-transferase, subunit B